MGNITAENLIEELTQAIPGFSPENPDLTPVALGELVGTLMERQETGDDVGFRELAQKAMEFMEVAAQSGDEAVDELIMASFLEGLSHLSPRCQEVLQMAGPATLVLRQRYEARWGPICPEDRDPQKWPDITPENWAWTKER